MKNLAEKHMTFLELAQYCSKMESCVNCKHKIGCEKVQENVNEIGHICPSDILILIENTEEDYGEN